MQNWKFPRARKLYKIPRYFTRVNIWGLNCYQELLSANKKTSDILMCIIYTLMEKCDRLGKEVRHNSNLLCKLGIVK